MLLYGYVVARMFMQSVWFWLTACTLVVCYSFVSVCVLFFVVVCVS